MKPRVKWAVSLLAICIGVGIAIPVARQNKLNNQLLDAIRNQASAVTIRSLINQGADPNTSGGHVIDTALFLACESEVPANIHILLEAGATTAPIGQPHIGVLSEAACGNVNGPRRSIAEYRAIFEDLRKHGSDLEERDVLGFTPLMRAVWAGNTPAAEALIDMGANLEAMDKHGERVGDWAGFNANSFPSDYQTEMIGLFRGSKQAHEFAITH